MSREECVNRILASLSTWIVSAAILSGASLCWAQSYTVTDLGVSFSAYTATAINNNGQIVGAALPTGAPPSSNLSDPYLLSSDGTLTDLGDLGAAGDLGQSFGLNSLGQVVGFTGGGGFFFNGTLNALAPTNLEARGINTAGTIVGYAGWAEAFVIQDGVSTDLGNGLATAINTSGQFVGATPNFNNGQGTNPPDSLIWEATLWQPDLTATQLGFLGTGVESRAYAINDAGQVAGISYLTANYSPLHAFLYSNGTMTDIDTFNSSASWAFGINNNGVVVGMVDDELFPGYEYDAFVYIGGTMIDLNTLIPSGSPLILLQANGINDVGQIVGNAISTADDLAHPFLLTPIAPEITSVSPKSGAPGTLVTIRGKHFSAYPKACWVTINGVTASKWTKWTDKEIQFEVPANATTGKLVVTALLQKSNSESFTVK
jgi:probable HAF family extracellular repeat protein